MTVYIDIIFLENIILNFIILYATSIISKSKVNLVRIAIGSLIGSIYVVFYYLSKIEWYSNIFLKLFLSISIVYISFNTKNVKELLKILILFYLTSFVFGGATLGVIYIVNPEGITIQDGIIIGSYTIKTIFIGIILAFIILITAFKTVKAKFSKKDLFCNIVIKINNKQVKTKAMLDTGNLLKEPITNIPVLVVEHNLLYDVIPNEILDNIENILKGSLENIAEELKNEYISRLKVIPFSSLGKQNGMLLGIKADGLIVEKENKKKFIDKSIIGFYNRKLSKNGEYKALIGIDII